MNVRQLLEQSDDMIYHITTESNWEKIKHQGIIPQNASGNWAHIGYKNKTFLFTDPSQDNLEELVSMLVGKHSGWEDWSGEEWDKFTNDLVILLINPALVPNLELEPDPSSMDGIWLRTSTPIPPRAIMDVHPLSAWLE